MWEWNSISSLEEWSLLLLLIFNVKDCFDMMKLKESFFS